QFLDDPVRPPAGGDVADADVALHGRAPDAELQTVLDLAEAPRLVLAAGRRIAHDPHLVAGRDLRVGEVADVAEDASHRGTEAVDDAQFLGHRLAAAARLEEAFAHIDRIAGQERIRGHDPSRHHLAVDVAGDV